MDKASHNTVAPRRAAGFSPRGPTSTHRPRPSGRLAVAAACLVCLSLSTGARAAGDATFLLKAGRIYTMAEGDDWLLAPGMILVENGRITAVGRNIEAPSFVDVIDLPDAVIMPGLVAADSTLAGRNASQDSVGPRYRALDAFNAYADYRRVLAGGVTTVYLNPGDHRLVTGIGAVVKLGADRDAAVLSAAADLVINLGEPAFDPPPKQNWLVPPSSDTQIEPSDVQRPSSRLGQFLQLRESFDAALAYAAARRSDEPPDDGPPRPAYDDNLEALAAALEAKRTLRIDAQRAVDIEQAIDFCKRRGYQFVLTGGREAHLIADRIAAAGVPVVFEVPLFAGAPAADIGPDRDKLDDWLLIPAALVGLPVAVAQPRGAPLSQLSMHAAAARRAGLTTRQAVEAVTVNAARVLGLADRVGSIQPGRDADLLVLNGEPLRATTHVQTVYVNGRVAFDAQVAPAPRAVVVKAGAVWTGHQTITDGAVLIEDGRIVSVGSTVPVPPNARVIDAGPHAVLTPGFIDARGHLGLEGDKTRAGAELSPARALARARPEFHRVARAGVTSVLVSAYRPAARGSRISVIHTAGENRDEIIVKDVAGLIFSIRGADPATAPKTLKGALAAGKKYDDAWKKYAKDLEAWKKKTPQQKKEERPKEAEEVVEEEAKSDPVTGTWEGTISGGPFPNPQPFNLKMKLEGDRVTGSVETFFGGGEGVEIEGTFSEGHLTLELKVEFPGAAPTVEADIDREDHLTGTLQFANFSFDIEAERTEKETPEIKVTRTRRKKTDGKPQAPKKNEALEPYRDLFAGKIAVVIDVDDPALIDAILPIFEKDYKVPFVLVNAEGAGRLGKKLADAKTGVILPVASVRRVDGRDYLQSIDLSRAGIPLAFQSAAEDGARGLPDRAAYDVRRGMDAGAALRALTVDAARMMKCDDQIGVLAPGRRGDLLIFDGPPLEPGSRLLRVFINGKEVHP